MSMFLGKIHYWLYNKITWFEGLEQDIVRLADANGLPIQELAAEVNAKYGEPTGRKPLEEVIDTGNIHSWLQEKIQSAELRQAALITAILKEKPKLKNSLQELASKQGKAAAGEYDSKADTPEEAFNALNDYLLEGMPCDRVNDFLTNNENEFEWKTIMYLHKPYWLEVKGDVQNFYDMREEWIKSFVNTLNPGFTYEKSADGLNRITRK